MDGYLGETVVTELRDTPFEGFERNDWALWYISEYCTIDGDHHKTWALDQVARILHSTPVIVKLARWQDGQEEYRVSTAEPPSANYERWVMELEWEWDVDHDTGIAP